VKTPTACAHLLGERVTRYVAATETAWARVTEAARSQTRTARRNVNQQGQAALILTRQTVSGSGRRSDETAERLARSARRQLPASVQTLDHVEERLRLLDPAHTLARGWSITRNADGAVLRSAAEVQPGHTLTTQLASGTVRSTVEDTQ
jgi:exodeoxyribonuclease VII large subunit